jgi:hypothetical protein
MSDYYTNTSEYGPAMQPVQQPMAPTQQRMPLQQAPPAQQASMYAWSPLSVDYGDIMKRALKYILEGLAVAFVAYWLGKLELKEVLMLGMTAAAVFAILDTYSPTVSLGMRVGAGFGMGQSLFAGAAPALI